MEKEQDFKDLEAFKLLKLQESVTYFYKSWAKIENPVKKETLVSLMVESTVTTYVIATKSIETVTQKDITELDFNKIAKAIPLKLENLVQMYELLLGKKKAKDEASAARLEKQKEKWANVFDKIDLDKSEEITMAELLKYFQMKKIDISNVPRKDLSEAFGRMDTDGSKNISKDEFIQFCISKKSRAFNDAVSKIAEIEGLNKKVELSAEEQAALVEKEIAAMGLSQEKIDEYTRCFNLMDIAKDGNITKNGFITFLHLRRLEKFFTSDELAQIFRDMKGEVETANFQVDRAEFFRYLTGTKVNKKFISFLDTVFTKFIQQVIKVLESDEEFKARLKLDDEFYNKYASMFEFFDVDGTGTLKLKNLLPYIKKNNIDLSVPDGNKMFKEMGGDDDDGVTKNKFIEYLTNKSNSGFKSNIDEIAKKEGGFEEIKKKNQIRKSNVSSRKSLNDLNKSLSKASSGNELTLRVDAFMTTVDEKGLKYITKTQLEDFLKAKKLVNMFSKADSTAMFQEGGEKLKKEFLYKYYGKSKKFKSLVDYLWQGDAVTTPQTPLLTSSSKEGSFIEIDQGEPRSMELGMSTDDLEEDSKKKLHISNKPSINENPLSTENDENNTLEDEINDELNVEEYTEDPQQDEMLKNKRNKGGLFDSVKEDSPGDNKYVDQLIEENNELRAKIDMLELERTNLIQNQISLENSLRDAEDSMSKNNTQMNETLERIDVLNQNNMALNDQLKQVSNNNLENFELLKTYTRETESLNQKIKELEGELEKSQNLRNELKTQLEDQNLKLQNQLESLKNRNDELELHNQTLGKSKSEADQMLTDKISAKEKELLESNTKLNSLNHDLNTLKGQLNDTQESLKSKDNTIKANLAEITRLNDENKLLHQQFKSKEDEFMSKLRDAEKNKLETDNKLAEALKLIEDLKKENQSLKADLTRLQNEKKELEGRLQQFEQMEKEFDETKKKLKAKTSEHDQLKQDSEGLKKSLQEKESQENKYKDEINSLKNAREALQIQKNELETKFAVLSADKDKGVQNLQESTKSMQNKLDTLEEDKKALLAKISSLENEKKEIQQTKENSEKDSSQSKAEIKRISDELGKKEEAIKNLERDLQALRLELQAKNTQIDENSKKQSSDLAKLSSENTQKDSDIKSKDAEIKRLNDLLKAKNEESQSSLDKSKQGEQELKNQLSNLSDSQKKTDDENRKLKEELENVRKVLQNTLLQVSSNEESVRKSQKNIQDTIKEKEDLEKQLRDKQSESLSAQQQNKDLESKLKAERSNLLAKEKELQELKDKLKSTEEQNRALQRENAIGNETSDGADKATKHMLRSKAPTSSSAQPNEQNSQEFLAQKEKDEKLNQLLSEKDQMIQALNEELARLRQSQEGNDGPVITVESDAMEENSFEDDEKTKKKQREPKANVQGAVTIRDENEHRVGMDEKDEEILRLNRELMALKGLIEQVFIDSAKRPVKSSAKK